MGKPSRRRCVQGDVGRVYDFSAGRGELGGGLPGRESQGGEGMAVRKVGTWGGNEGAAGMQDRRERDGHDWEVNGATTCGSCVLGWGAAGDRGPPVATHKEVM